MGFLLTHARTHIALAQCGFSAPASPV